jgi:hypothetical protein
MMAMKMESGSMKIGRQKENKKANGRHEKRKVYM